VWKAYWDFLAVCSFLFSRPNSLIRVTHLLRKTVTCLLLPVKWSVFSEIIFLVNGVQTVNVKTAPNVWYVLQLDELRDNLSSMEAKMASLTAMNLSLQRPKTPAAKVCQSTGVCVCMCAYVLLYYIIVRAKWYTCCTGTCSVQVHVL